MTSKKNKPIKDLRKFEDLETIESGPTRDKDSFVPEPGVTYEKPDQVNEGGNKK